MVGGEFFAGTHTGIKPNLMHRNEIKKAIFILALYDKEPRSYEDQPGGIKVKNRQVVITVVQYLVPYSKTSNGYLVQGCGQRPFVALIGTYSESKSI